MTVNVELETIYREAVLDQFEVLFLDLPGGTE
jgi:hypothetical protein